MLCFITSRKVKTQMKHNRKVCGVCGEGAVTDRMCPKWFVKLCAGDFSLGCAPRSCSPVEIDDDQIGTLIENKQSYIQWEIANILKIPTSIKLLVKMRNVFFKLKGLFGQPLNLKKIFSLPQL